MYEREIDAFALTGGGLEIELRGKKEDIELLFKKLGEPEGLNQQSSEQDKREFDLLSQLLLEKHNEAAAGNFTKDDEGNTIFKTRRYGFEGIRAAEWERFIMKIHAITPELAVHSKTNGWYRVTGQSVELEIWSPDEAGGEWGLDIDYIHKESYYEEEELRSDPEYEDFGFFLEDWGYTAVILEKYYGDGPEVFIPERVANICRDFLQDPDIGSFEVSDGNKEYAAVDGVLFNRKRTTLIKCPARKKGSYAIPDGVTRLGGDYGEPFGACCGLTQVQLPDSLHKVDGGCFEDCEGLEAIYVSDSHEYFSSMDGILFNNDKTILLAYPRGKQAGQFDVPNGVKEIEDYAFANCQNLTDITIPNGVTEIGRSVFAGCTNLSSIAIPDNVTGIADYTFNNCPNLTIVGNAGSYADGYAKKRDVPFTVAR